MAISPSGRTLYPMLEGPVAEDTAAGLPADLRIFEVKLERNGIRARFTGNFSRYRLEHPANAIDDFIAVNDHGAGGRAPDRPDENELILVRLDRPLEVAPGIIA